MLKSMSIITALLCLIACNHDSDVTLSDDKAAVVLKINTTELATRAQIESEVTVNHVEVLVFEDAANSGEYLYAYMVSGSQLNYQSDQSTEFMAILNKTDQPVKLYVVINSQNAFTSYSPSAGDTEEELKVALQKAYAPTEYAASGLPMYGTAVLENIGTETVSNVLNITVLRAIARVDVVKDLESSSPAFTMQEVYVFRPNSMMQIVPNALVSGSMKVDTPSVPSDAVALSGTLLASSNAAESFTSLYVPEANSYTDSEDQRLNATVIVVGGILEGDDEISYYRIDFNSGLNGHPFGQILRNYQYIFTIKEVSTTGWSTPELAAENASSYLVVEVQQWEEFSTNIYIPGDYLAVSTRTVNMPFLPSYTRTVDVESGQTYQIQWLDDSGNLTGEAVSEYDVALSNDFFTATIVADANNSTVSHIEFTSSLYNKSDDEYSYTLRITANNGIIVDIVVTKESPSRYSDKVIQVLSTGADYGSLGTYSTTVAATLGMRNVLDNNFSPTSSYPFKIGGFFYWTVTISGTSYTNATTTANVASFKKIISNVDVLILTYSNVTSTLVAEMLLDDWLVNNTNRVLWVNRDNASSNVNVVARTATDGDGTWANIGTGYNATAGYRTAGASDYAYNNATEVTDFFDGPFGVVPENMALYAADGTAGASLIETTSKQNVTPLIYNNYTGYTDYMLLGVNKKRGIVYSGESQFFTGSASYPMSAGANSSGTIDTSTTGSKNHTDVLNANLWAWIVGRVIYGPPQ